MFDIVDRSGINGTTLDNINYITGKFLWEYTKNITFCRLNNIWCRSSCYITDLQIDLQIK